MGGKAGANVQKAYPALILEAAIPCITQSDGWNAGEKDAYYEILSRCDIETMICREYEPGCMQKRNRYMVERSSLVIAAYAGGGGGTKNTIDYANSAGICVKNLLDPDRLDDVCIARADFSRTKK